LRCLDEFSGLGKIELQLTRYGPDLFLSATGINVVVLGTAHGVDGKVAENDYLERCRSVLAEIDSDRSIGLY
jgi:hypothetical protein